MLRAVALSMIAILVSCCAKPNGVIVRSNTVNLCRDWRHETISKDDKLTEQTAAQIEASNKSRPAWGCKYGQNKG